MKEQKVLIFDEIALAKIMKSLSRKIELYTQAYQDVVTAMALAKRPIEVVELWMNYMSKVSLVAESELIALTSLSTHDVVDVGVGVEDFTKRVDF